LRSERIEAISEVCAGGGIARHLGCQSKHRTVALAESLRSSAALGLVREAAALEGAVGMERDGVGAQRGDERTREPVADYAHLAAS
jgi:hypothetical protein